MSKLPIHLENRDKSGARLHSPSANRNKQPIAEALTPFIPQGARALEIASGTGEHAAHMCASRPDITWQPSDIDAESRASQDAWREDVQDQMQPSKSIDTTAPRWWAVLEADVMYCANMIHIAPWEAAIGLAKGAGNILEAGGTFALYGPFHEGEATAPSNLEFDANLKRRNPGWGVRPLSSVTDLFAKNGLSLTKRIVMPANNLLLIFVRS